MVILASDQWIFMDADNLEYGGRGVLTLLLTFCF